MTLIPLQYSKVVLCLSFVSIMLTGCSRSYDLGDKAADEVAVDTTNPTWANGVGAVIQAKCVSCHTPASLRSKFVPGNTPANMDGIGAETFFSDSAKASLVQSRIADTVTPMPPNFATPLSTNEKTALTTWLATKSVSITTLCGTSGTSVWTLADASPVIARDCSGCHTGASLAAFDSITKIKTYRGSMLQYLVAGTMPQGNSTYTASGSGLSLYKWLCFGAEFK